MRFVSGLKEDLRGCIVRVGKEEEVEEAKRRGAVYVEYVPERVVGYDEGRREEFARMEVNLEEMVGEYGRKVLMMGDDEIEVGLAVLREVGKIM